jgi:hypothetical protein
MMCGLDILEHSDHFSDEKFVIFQQEDIRKDAEEVILFIDSLSKDLEDMKLNILKVLNYEIRDGRRIIESFRKCFHLIKNLPSLQKVKLYEMYFPIMEINSLIVKTSEEIE